MNVRVRLRQLPACVPDLTVVVVVVALELTNLAIHAGATDHDARDAALLVVSAAPLLLRRYPARSKPVQVCLPVRTSRYTAYGRPPCRWIDPAPRGRRCRSAVSDT